jgi:hypothetical protein
MFKRNDRHLQSDMFDPSMELSPKMKQRLDESWAGTFYRDFFCRLDESVFEVLYSDKSSRPNVPVNQLVAFEVLKAGQGWTDEQTYDQVCFNLQARRAMGIARWGETPFTLRTVYNFRRAISMHAEQAGVNLFVEVFRQVTGEQQAAFDIGSSKIRMDSTQVASNMSKLSRLRLLLTVLERVHRAMDQTDRQRLAERFGQYGGSAKRLAYTLRMDESDNHVVAIGKLMSWLIRDLKDKYGDTQAYETMQRVFREHYIDFSAGVMRRLDEEVDAKSMQSPDDPEATYRQKGSSKYKGYVANVTETCDTENDQQLIVDVQVQANSADDAQMLVEAADGLAERTDIDTLYTDGGYNSAEADEKLTGLGIKQVQTGIRGRQSSRLGREAFDWEVDSRGRPQMVTCPNGQQVDIEKGRKDNTFAAKFDDRLCEQCPLKAMCPTKRLLRKRMRVLRFSFREVQAALRQQRSRAQQLSGSNPRAAVEATIWSLKSPMRRERAPYRGCARVTMFMVSSAAMVNIRRLTKMAKRSPEGPRDAAFRCQRTSRRAVQCLLADMVASAAYRITVLQSWLPRLRCAADRYRRLEGAA